MTVKVIKIYHYFVTFTFFLQFITIKTVNCEILKIAKDDNVIIFNLKRDNFIEFVVNCLCFECVKVFFYASS